MLLKKNQNIEFEIRNNRGKENWEPKEQKKQKVAFTNVKIQLFLPKELFMNVMMFLQPGEISYKIRPLSKCYWRLVKELNFWNFYDNMHKIPFLDLYTKNKLILERRSKGKLFEVTNKLSGQQHILRQINTGKANAFCYDGIQTSVLREISYLKTLPPHPNINQIVDVHLSDNLVSILYPYHPLNLRDKLKSSPLSTSQILNYFKQIVQAVQHLHKFHILHRNLKLDNILITSNNQIKITDFVLARLETYPMMPYTPEDPKERERSNREIHRLWYRAPEMLFRKTYYANEIDIWSLGCILAELALGAPLFKGRNEIEYLFQVFQFIGSPDQFDWEFLCNNKDIKIKLPFWKKSSLNLSKLNDQQLDELRRNRPDVYRKLQQLNHTLGTNGMDLLEKCLSIRFRPNIDEIVNHDFFNCNMEIELNGQFDELVFSNYLDNFQLELNQTMRITLVDWLMDVSTHFDLLGETLHLAISYLDLSLGQLKADKQNLQLIGVTCLKIADVYNELSKEFYKQENCKAYAYITADEYQPIQIIEQEKQILQILDYRLTYRTTLHYFRILSNSLDMQIKLVGEFYCDFFLLTYESILIDRNLLATLCLIMAIQHLQSNIVFKSGYTIKQLDDGLQLLFRGWSMYVETLIPQSEGYQFQYTNRLIIQLIYMNYIAKYIFRNPDKYKRVHVFNLTGQINTIMTYKVYKALKKFNPKKSKAIAIIINSTGGSVAQSYLIYQKFNQLRLNHQLPIITFAEDQALAAAFYLLSMGDKIYCDPVSVIGGVSLKIETIKTKILQENDVEIRNYSTNNQSLIQYLDPLIEGNLPKNLQNINDSQQEHLQNLIKQSLKERANNINLNDFYIASKTKGLVDGLMNYQNALEQLYPHHKQENLTTKTQQEKAIEFFSSLTQLELVQ